MILEVIVATKHLLEMWELVVLETMKHSWLVPLFCLTKNSELELNHEAELIALMVHQFDPAQ